jgi:opacity protein-like surface antigen
LFEEVSGETMKKFVVGFAVATALLSIADAASAADMVVKARPAAKHDPCGVARFSGFYVGGNAGAIAYTALRADSDAFIGSALDVGSPAEYSANRIGVTAGIQAGYDWQFCNKVFGVVADWNWADTATIARVGPNSLGITDTSFRSRMDWFSTIRARAGVAVNDTLFYVTGGVAVARIKSTATHHALIPDVVESNEQFSSSGIRFGFVGGVGAEFALRNNWSLNTELLYMQFQKDTATFFSPTQQHLVSFEHHDSAWVGRAGLNYRWDDPRAAYAATNVQGGAPVFPCGPSRFNGGYVGGNAGAVSYTALRQDRDVFSNGIGDYSATGTGLTAGIQVGWDWQSCNALLGVVADWNWTNADTVQRQNPNDAFVSDQSIKAKMDWFSTIRARAGLVVDDTMIYVTGGLAAADIETTLTHRTVALNEQHRFSDTRWGFAGGVGAEFALSGGWSLNTELLYLQFSKNTDAFRSGISPFVRNVSFENHNSAFVSRAGLNYRWDNVASASANHASPCGPARFSGGYVGGNVGAIRRTSLTDDQDGFLSNTQHTGIKAGATAGVQAGYDWQSCRRVFGIVADLNFANADTFARLEPNNAAVPDASIHSKMDWFGTVRARSGLAVNDALVYLTGGVALARIESQVSLIVPVFNLNEHLTSSNTRWGWTAGAGAEFALANGWSVNGEVLYMRFRKEADTFRFPTGSTSFEHTDTAWVGRVGVNYRWGAGG